MLVEACLLRAPKEILVSKLRGIPLLCRGPKPVAALRALGLSPTLVAPEPNTWRELLAVLGGFELSDKHVFVQEYGDENQELTQALRAKCRKLSRVPIYAWKLPDDQTPLELAIDQLVSGQADVVCFTSAQQIRHLFQVADRLGTREPLRQALLSGVLVASIGPITTEAIEAHGGRVTIVPEHPKMGHLIKAIAEYYAVR
jgi:uroporphyrinogen-III synthase